MSRSFLTVNAGSSSIKFALFDAGPPLAATPRLRGVLEGIGTTPRLQAVDPHGAVLAQLTFAQFAGHDLDTQHRASLDALLRWLAQHLGATTVSAVGHRIVHGGEQHAAPLRLMPAELDALDALCPLAPLHQPYNLAAARAFIELLPEAPHIACFDTAFHRTQAPLTRRFALPRALDAAGIRRYGFHGLSYEYIATILPQHLGAAAEGRVVVAHLGNGASLCALQDRRSVATTMGFTALDGLMMGTRCGALDPGVLIHLLEYGGYDLAGLKRLLYHESGLLGVSGISSDMRELLASAAPEAAEAVALFCQRIAQELGALAATLGGLDALVFTAGIGEHAAPVRAAVCRQGAWLGMALDEAANAHHATRISTAESRVPVLVLPTNEEWMIAHHVAALAG